MLAEELLEALDAKKAQALAPVFLVLGEESFLVEQVTRRLREVSAEGGIAGFNEDKLTAGESDADTAIAAAKMLPMMAPRRFVLVRSVERWEPRGTDDEGRAAARGKKATEGALDRIASYAADPNPSTVLVLAGTKLHGQRRIVTMAKKGGFLVACDPLKRGPLLGWVVSRAKRLGHAMSRDVAEHLIDLTGTDLGTVADALERLSLYVGAGKPITEDAVATLVARVRQSTVWDLTDAVCARQLAKALVLLSEMDLGRGADLQTLGAIASSVRKLAKLEGRLRAGDSAEAAAAAVGIPPFRAQAMRDAVKRLPSGALPRWLALLSETDVALKGGARRGGASVLESMVIAMCR